MPVTKDQFINQDIRQVIADYARLLDHGRFEELGRLFTDDATYRLTEAGSPVAGSKEVVKWLEGQWVARGEKRRMLHGLFTPIIDNKGTSAHAECDYVAHGVVTPIAGQPDTINSSAGRLFFELVRGSERWRIREIECERFETNDRYSIRTAVPLPQNVSEEEKILRTLADYSALGDFGRYDEVEDIYTEDATYSVTGTGAAPTRGRKAIRTWLEGFWTRRGSSRRTIHGLYLPIIELHGESAHAEADYSAFRYVDKQIVNYNCGRYFYNLVKQADRWRIKEMECEVFGLTDRNPSRNALKLGYTPVDEYQGIRRTITDYGLLYDYGRMVELGNIYTQDAAFFVNGKPAVQGRDEIRPYLDRVGLSGAAKRQMHHGMFLPTINLAGDSAAAECDWNESRSVGGKIITYSSGRYYFEMQRDDDRWRIRKMNCELLKRPDDYQQATKRQD